MSGKQLFSPYYHKGLLFLIGNTSLFILKIPNLPFEPSAPRRPKNFEISGGFTLDYRWASQAACNVCRCHWSTFYTVWERGGHIPGTLEHGEVFRASPDNSTAPLGIGDRPIPTCLLLRLFVAGLTGRRLPPARLIVGRLGTQPSPTLSDCGMY